MRSVLVTGASSGIGRAIALRLDSFGWRVFAGVRSDTDAKRLVADASGHLRTVHLDLTDDATIDQAAESIASKIGQGLQGLVNNAGVAVQGPLEYISRDALAQQMDVNVTGQVACTQRFLDLLRLGGGRIVFMSSVQGSLSSIPLFGPYCASKRALEAFAETFRIELAPDGVKVVVVAPGTTRTDIWDDAAGSMEDEFERLPPEGQERYAGLLELGSRLSLSIKGRGAHPERVARTVSRALEARSPRRRYLVGDARVRTLLERSIPAGWRDAPIKKAIRIASERRPHTGTREI